MKSTLQHMQINVSNKDSSLPFYKEMLQLLGYTIFMEDDWGVGLKDPVSGLVIWIAETGQKYKDNKFHRKATGLNHLAFKVDSKQEVDDFFEKFVKKNHLNTLYSSPKAFPEYTPDYYAVFFEDPDRLKIEIMTL